MSPFLVEKKSTDQIDKMETENSDRLWFEEFNFYGSVLNGLVNPWYATVYYNELSDLGPAICSRLQFQVLAIYFECRKTIWSWSQLNRAQGAVRKVCNLWAVANREH